MATLLSRLITGIKQFIAKIEERAFLTNGHQASRGTSQHPGSRNGVAGNGHANGAAITVPPGITTIYAAPSHMSAHIPHRAKQQHSIVLGTDLTTGQVVRLPYRDRQEGHAYACGVSGMGKSVLLLHMILEDIRAGYGVALIEPHDLTAKVLAGIPDDRLEDVVYLDMTDLQSIFSINLMAVDDPTNMSEVARVSSFVMHLFEQVWSVGTHTPQLAQVLRNTTRTCIEAGVTFAEIPLLLGDDTVREKLVSKVSNPQTKLFWEAYNRMSPRDRQAYVLSTINKCDAYLHEPMIANIVSQATTSISFRQIMDEGKILLVNMPRQFDEISRFAGSLLIGKLLMAAFSRVDLPEHERRQFYLYVDEFQKFSSSEFKNFLEEVRKFRCSVTIAHQSLSQLEEEHRITATGAATMIVFRCLGDESRVLARSYDATPQPVVVGMEPERAVVSDVLSHLLSRGHQDSRVTGYAHTVLSPFETYCRTKAAERWACRFECHAGELILSDFQVHTARAQLNDCLYRCMVEKNAAVPIPPLAIYVLAVSMGQSIEYLFSPYIITPGIEWLNPHTLKEFDQRADKFGQASFISPESATSYITSFAKYGEKYKRMAEAIIRMLSELRATMTLLSTAPVMVDTGQLIPEISAPHVSRPGKPGRQ